MNSFRLLPFSLMILTLFLVLKVSSLVTRGYYVMGPQSVQAQEEEAGGIAEAVKRAHSRYKISDERPDENLPQESPKPDQILLDRINEQKRELQRLKQELESREALLMSRESKLQDQLKEIATFEERMKAQEEDLPSSVKNRLNHLVSMYENMKSKDAAEIFNRLNGQVLIDLTLRINPQKLAEIMAAMDPEAAEQLTTRLALEMVEQDDFSTQSLPKIQGLN